MEIQKAERLSKLPPYLYVAIRQKVREAQARGVDVISLGVGDPDLPTPRHVVEALAKAAADPANHQYPTGEQKGMPAFRRAVAAWYARRFGVTVDPETEVLALIGSKEGNHHLALALLDPADVAIVPDPGYPAYIASAVFAGAEVVRAPLRRENGFLLDFADVPAGLEILDGDAKLLRQLAQRLDRRSARTGFDARDVGVRDPRGRQIPLRKTTLESQTLEPRAYAFRPTALGHAAPDHQIFSDISQIPSRGRI